MNLYQYHNNPDVLPGHNKKEELLDLYSLPYFFEKYENQPNELKKRESVIAKSAEYSFHYACMLDKRFPLGEPAILKTDAFTSYYLSMFPDCLSDTEEIKKSAIKSYRYAVDVLKARFPLGEPVILTNGSFAADYKIKFPEAFTSPKEKHQMELSISKDAIASYNYAIVVLKARFPLGEQAILNGCAGSICNYKIKFPEAFTSPKEKQQMELSISKHRYESYMYATEVLKARFLLGEPAIKSINDEYTYKYKAKFPDAFK